MVLHNADQIYVEARNLTSSTEIGQQGDIDRRPALLSAP